MFTRMTRTDHNLKGFAYDVNDACYCVLLCHFTQSGSIIISVIVIAQHDYYNDCDLSSAKLKHRILEVLI